MKKENVIIFASTLYFTLFLAACGPAETQNAIQADVSEGSDLSVNVSASDNDDVETAAIITGETPKMVVELFTSQGCSSCPPANEFVGELTRDPNKLVLTYGVTYWDYLGWKDTFGKLAFTERQREYGQSFGIGNVYTPQIVLNGSAHSPRYKRQDVETMNMVETDVTLDLALDKGELVLNTNAEKSVIIAFMPGWQTVDVKEGENRGQTLKMANVVDSVTVFDTSATAPMPAKDGLAYAALVHDSESQKILSASVVYPARE